uniref:Uncharacterized protein n=1 Tax=Knipowitschia caucasica TaxID=637954 RepID=A0AAV2L8U7_KNICA
MDNKQQFVCPGESGRGDSRMTLMHGTVAKCRKTDGCGVTSVAPLVPSWFERTEEEKHRPYYSCFVSTSIQRWTLLVGEMSAGGKLSACEEKRHIITS